MKVKKFFKWFGNDDDGFTMPEFAATVAMVVWTGATGYMLYLLGTDSLTGLAVDLYSVINWLPLGVISGVFGGTVFSYLKNKGGGPRFTEAPGGGGRYEYKDNNEGKYHDDYQRPTI